MENNKNSLPLIHIYPQTYNHEPIFIVSSRDGLLQLQKTINEALEKGEGESILISADGEGYECKIIMNNENWQSPFWQRMQLPYADELIDDTPNAIGAYNYLNYSLKHSDQIPTVEKQIEADKIHSMEMTKKINDYIQRKIKD